MAADGQVRVEREQDQDKENAATAEEEHQSSIGESDYALILQGWRRG
jgi:hypothetical protein